MLWFDYKDDLRLYKKQLLAFGTLQTQIQYLISCFYFIYPSKCNIIYNILMSLKQKLVFFYKT